MNNRLDGKVAIVTGAGQGVGQGIAFALAGLGASVAVVGRTLSKCETTCKEIESRGGKALPVLCEVKSSESLKQCVDTVVEVYGGINILVNNAQQVEETLGKLHDIDSEAFNTGWQSGAMATFNLMKLCYPYLKGDGCIINMGTAAAKRWDISNYGVYAAVKESIRTISRAAACEWGKDNIRTNVILPLAASPGLAHWMEWDPEDAKAFIAALPMRRVGECEKDIGNFVAMLCTESSQYVNGQTISLDGGAALVG